MKPYNPLEKENLGESVAASLMKQGAIPLADVPRFSGAGVYVVYYSGKFDAYARMAEWNSGGDQLIVPIYVGKAVPIGGRKGNIDPEVSAKGNALFSRLDEHRKSILQAKNLEIEDFWCRFLVVDDIWIPLGESLLIQRFRPIWNSVIDGFGNHDPGSKRHAGARPAWDTIHPGRPWAEKCAPSNITEEQIRHHIDQYWKLYKGPDLAE